MIRCKEFQDMIDDFNKHKLSIDEEELFVEHLNECTDCREELEIYYIVTYGLSDDEEAECSNPKYKNYLDSYDFKGLVDYKLKESSIFIKKAHAFDKFIEFCWLAGNIFVFMTFIVFIIIIYL